MKRWTLCLIALLLVCRSAIAEQVALCFTDPVACPPCRVLDSAWQTQRVQGSLARLRIERKSIDVNRCGVDFLRAWKINRWPTTVLIEVEQGRTVRELRRRTGAMDADALVDFLEGLPRSPMAVQFDWSPSAAHHAAVVIVQAENRRGSGVYVVEGGLHLVLTCQHVVESAAEAMVMFSDGTRRTGQVRTDKFGHDVAAIVIDPHGAVQPLRVAASTPQYARVEMLGFGGPANRLRHYWGNLRLASPDHALYDAGVASGDSGGPVLDANGDVVGLLAHGDTATKDPTDGWEGTFHTAGGPAWKPIRNFVDRVRQAVGCRPGGCGPGGCGPGGSGQGGGLYPPDDVRPTPQPQPTPAQPTPNYSAELQRISDRLAQLESRQVLQGPPGQDGRNGRDGKDGRHGKDADMPAIIGAINAKLPTPEAIADVMFAKYGAAMEARLKQSIPPLYVEVIDPTGKYSAPPVAIRFMEGEGLRLHLDPTTLAIPQGTN